MQLTRRVLQAPTADRSRLVAEMVTLYPRKLDEMSPEILEVAKGKYAADVASLLAAAGEAGTEDLPGEADVLQMLLQVVFNAFEGGLYIKKAMLNHCCRPNCITFQAGERVRSDGNTVSTGKSEVVATQAIAAGTEVTISYLVPVEQSHGTRSRKWEAQHLCALAPSPWPAEMEQFNVPAEGPFDQEGAHEDLETIEDDLDALDDQLNFEQMRPAEAIELLANLPIKELLHPRHLTACRVHNLIVRCAHLLTPKKKKKEPTPEALILVLRSSLEVRETMLLGWAGAAGKDHCEIARVQCDIHAALDCLANNHKEALEEAFPEKFGTWQKSSKAEYAARKEYLRISKLYD